MIAHTHDQLLGVCQGCVAEGEAKGLRRVARQAEKAYYNSPRLGAFPGLLKWLREQARRLKASRG